MKLRVITKICMALAIACGVLFGISVAPLLVAGVLAVFTLICLLIAVLILFAGLFVWLFTAGKTSIFGIGANVASFGTNLFSYIQPVTDFSFTYFTPVVGWIAFGAGALGIVLSVVGLVTAGRSQQSESAAVPAEADAVAPTEEPLQASSGKRKKTKRKKKKTDRGVCIGTLVACIVLAVLAVIAVAVAARFTATAQAVNVSGAHYKFILL